jgi:hypothetical protein
VNELRLGSFGGGGGGSKLDRLSSDYSLICQNIYGLYAVILSEHLMRKMRNEMNMMMKRKHKGRRQEGRQGRMFSRE